jgi:hypothetical protein
VAWPILLVVVAFVAVGRIGFNPTDEGLVQANAQRILRGEIPHVDIISPRPFGSAYLHVVDVLLPTPLVATSRLLAMGQIMVFTMALACLTFRRGPLRWSPVQCVLVAAAFLVNLHTFPVTAWHTIDGLFLVGLGFLALAVGLARERRSWSDLALVLLGAALLVKQSFAPALVIGLLWIGIDAWPRGGRVLARRIVRGAVFAAIPAFAYTIMLVLAGGLGRAWLQLRSGGDNVVEMLSEQVDLTFDEIDVWFVLALVAVVALVIADRLRARRTDPGAHGAGDAASLAARTVVTISLVALLVTGRLELLGAWGTLVLLLLLAVIAWEALVGRGIDGIALLVAAVGAMSMLSWGYAVPDLVAGSMALVLVDRLWRGAPFPERAEARVLAIGATAAATVVFVTLAAIVHDQRTNDVYRHPEGAALTVDLGSIDDDFAGIRSNDNVARYLRQVQACLNEYPASRVAILPDNAMLSPVLDLENPLPSDWLFLDEQADSGGVVVDAARRLDREGDYLVLFETVPAHAVAYEPVPARVPVDADFYFYGDLGGKIRDALTGTPVSCGSFVGVHSPPPERSTAGT